MRLRDKTYRKERSLIICFQCIFVKQNADNEGNRHMQYIYMYSSTESLSSSSTCYRLNHFPSIRSAGELSTECCLAPTRSSLFSCFCRVASPEYLQTSFLDCLFDHLQCYIKILIYTLVPIIG